MSHRKKYSLDELLKEGAPGPHEDPLPGILDSEWPPYETHQPVAYRVVDWHGRHVAVVFTRERAHAIKSQTDFDPRLNTIYAIYQDETEKCIQSGLSIMDDLNSPDIEEKWKAAMQNAGIDKHEIEITLSYYQNQSIEQHEE